ncbi:MAG: sensor histidine kinase [Solobacterium sp.]|nr:sensor histidine kinase [Solobacterium sp.]
MSTKQKKKHHTPALIRKMNEKLNGLQPSIRALILTSFSVVAAASVMFLGIVLFQQFADRSRSMMTDSTERLTEQAVINMEKYLTSMRRISDTLYYTVIKDKDFGTDNVSDEMTILYEANQDDLTSIALYTEDGKLISASPVAIAKDGLDVTRESWFTSANSQVENLHFSTPHVQNLFDDPSYSYNWVISLSRVVELTTDGVPTEGVLLVDMNYSTIEQMLDEVNSSTNGQYSYLCDSEGKIIYHPRQMQISSGLYEENNLNEALLDDGVHEEKFNGSSRVVIVDTISYTGWKLISVIPSESFSLSLTSMRFYLVLLITVLMLAIILVNRLVADRIAGPLTRLDEAIHQNGPGDSITPADYEGGSSEVQHLGRTLEEYQEKNQKLMKDIVVEQEEKRKSELDALQSQINPHFLYNTLDSIVWMIESAQYKEAVFMITELASLFRVSLSKGRTIIPICDELKHARNYMNIQMVRFKNSFTCTFDVDPEVEQYCTVKLIIQPILENAVYYGVKNMDEDGKITVHGFRRDSDIFISVEDNGFGIPKEDLDTLLDENRDHTRSHGSGVGLINVHKRIQLRFGPEYGLKIESELDQGTTVTVHLPAILYSEETRTLLEHGKKQDEDHEA